MSISVAEIMSEVPLRVIGICIGGGLVIIMRPDTTPKAIRSRLIPPTRYFDPRRSFALSLCIALADMHRFYSPGCRLTSTFDFGLILEVDARLAT